MAATPEQREVFRRALDRARAQAGLSQRDLARRLGVTASAVSQWEAGQSAPRPTLVTQMEDVLGLSEGSLARLLGYLPVSAEAQAVSSVLEALEADPRLGARKRDLLATMYDKLVRQGDGEDRRQ